MKNNLSTAHEGGGFAPIFHGLFIIVSLGIVGSFISSLLLAWTGIKENSLPYFVWIISGISVFLGGLFAGKKSGVKGWYYGGMAGIAYILLILVIRFLALDLPLTSGFLLYFLAAFLIGAFGGMVGVNMKHR